MARTYLDDYYRAPGRPPKNKRVAADANAWADKLRREKASQQQAPVMVKPAKTT